MSKPVKKTLAIICVVLAIAGVAVLWNVANTIDVVTVAAVEADTGPEDHLDANIIRWSPTLDAFYRSEDLDPYVARYVATDPSRQSKVEAFTADCDRAKTRVFPPPWTGRVSDACATMLAFTTDSTDDRRAAIMPVFLYYVSACRAISDDTGQSKPSTGALDASHYSRTQRKALVKIADKALDADCEEALARRSEAGTVTPAIWSGRS